MSYDEIQISFSKRHKSHESLEYRGATIHSYKWLGWRATVSLNGKTFEVRDGKSRAVIIAMAKTEIDKRLQPK